MCPSHAHLCAPEPLISVPFHTRPHLSTITQLPAAKMCVPRQAYVCAHAHRSTTTLRRRFGGTTRTRDNGSYRQRNGRRHQRGPPPPSSPLHPAPHAQKSPPGAHHRHRDPPTKGCNANKGGVVHPFARTPCCLSDGCTLCRIGRGKGAAHLHQIRLCLRLKGRPPPINSSQPCDRLNNLPGCARQARRVSPRPYK